MHLGANLILTLSRFIICMRGSRKFFQIGSNFLFDKGKEDPNSTESGPSLAASETPLDGVSLAGR